jgi:hypothetical protein
VNHTYTPEQKLKRLEACRRYRKNHPERVKQQQLNQNEKRKGVKRYNSEVRAKWYAQKKIDKSWYEKIKKQQNKRARKIKEFIANYKLKKGCIDCGYNKHHSALEFDHINGEKKLNVCFAKSVAQALKEIEKCEVVCSNCHRVRTYNRIYPN